METPKPPMQHLCSRAPHPMHLPLLLKWHLHNLNRLPPRQLPRNPPLQ